MTITDETQSTVPAVANLRETRKQMIEAKNRHPAGNKAAAKKVPTKVAEKETTTRHAPSAPGKPKLKWRGDIAEADGVEVGHRVEKDGKWNAVVKVSGKNETLASGVSHTRAYAVIVAFYHRGERPAAKNAVAS